MELNEIIKNLCDWTYKTGVIIRRLEFYTLHGSVYMSITLQKKDVCIKRDIYIGSENKPFYNEYECGLDLNYALQTLEEATNE